MYVYSWLLFLRKESINIVSKGGMIMTLGEKIQFQRKRRGMTQEELGEMMEVSRQTVTKWESNQSFPEIKKIVKLSYFFNVSTDYLLKDEIEDFEEHLVQYIVENKEEIYKKSIPSIVKFFMILGGINFLGVIFLYVDSYIHPVTITDWNGVYYHGFLGYLYINEKRELFYMLLLFQVISFGYILYYYLKRRKDRASEDKDG